MSRALAQNRTGKFVRALLLATTALALLRPASPAAAQDIGLRGSVAGSLIQQSRTPTTSWPVQGGTSPTAPDPIPGQQADPTPAYRPVDADAVPDGGGDAATAGSSDPTDGTDGDAFADEPAPMPRPATAPASTATQGTGKAAKRRKPAQVNDEIVQELANPRAAAFDSDEKQSLDPRAERTGAIEGAKRKPDDDPFAPLGIKVGSFTLRPAIEQGVTATSNADSSFGGRPAVLSETTLRFDAASDWASNAATLSGYGTFRRTLSGYDVRDARGRLEGTVDLDLDRDWRAIARLGYEAAPESANSPVVIEDTLSQPLRQSIDGSLGISKDLGKIRLGLTGAATHDAYGDADLSSGGTLSQKDRDSTLYTATLRGGYEISPALTPFAELEVGKRIFDQRVDDSGYARSSNRVGARAGLALDLGEKLGGEFSLGWIRETFDDDRLAPISGATASADFKWSPVRGTVVGLRGDTTLEDTTTPGESGSILYEGRLTAARQVRANLTASAGLGLGWRDYLGSDGHDLIYSADASLTWWLNRYAGITGRVRHEALTSNLPYRDSRTDSVYLGLTLQR